MFEKIRERFGKTKEPEKNQSDVSGHRRKFSDVSGIAYDDGLSVKMVSATLEPYLREHYEVGYWDSENNHVVDHQTGEFLVNVKGYDQKFKIGVSRNNDMMIFPKGIQIALYGCDRISSHDWEWGYIASMFVRSLETLTKDFKTMSDDGPYPFRYDGVMPPVIQNVVRYGNFIRNRDRRGEGLRKSQDDFAKLTKTDKSVDADEDELRFFHKDGIAYDITLTQEAVAGLFKEKIAEGFYECKDYSQKISEMKGMTESVFMVKSSEYDYRPVRIMIFKIADSSDYNAPSRIEIDLDAVDDPMAYMQKVRHYRGSGIPTAENSVLSWISAGGYLAHMYVRSLSTMVDDFNAMIDGGPYRYAGVRDEYSEKITHGNIVRSTYDDGKNLFDLVNRRFWDTGRMVMSYDEHQHDCREDVEIDV